MIGMSILRQAYSLLGRPERLTAEEGNESGLLAVNQIYSELWHREHQAEFQPLAHLLERVQLTYRFLPAMAYGTAALLCLGAEDQRPYDRYLELYLRSLTHTGGTTRHRVDTLAEVTAV